MHPTVGWVVFLGLSVYMDACTLSNYASLSVCLCGGYLEVLAFREIVDIPYTGLAALPLS